MTMTNNYETHIQRDAAYLMWGLTALNVCVNPAAISLYGTGATILAGAALHPDVRGRACKLYRQLKQYIF